MTLIKIQCTCINMMNMQIMIMINDLILMMNDLIVVVVVVVVILLQRGTEMSEMK